MQGTEETTGYVPQATWYDIWDGTKVDASSGGQNLTFSAPMGHVPVHVQGGHVIPMQEAAQTTGEAWATPLSLLVALPRAGTPPPLSRRVGLSGPAPNQSSAFLCWLCCSAPFTVFGARALVYGLSKVHMADCRYSWPVAGAHGLRIT